MRDLLIELSLSYENRESVSILWSYNNVTESGYLDEYNILQKRLTHITQTHPDVREIIFVWQDGKVLFRQKQQKWLGEHIDNIYGTDFFIGRWEIQPKDQTPTAGEDPFTYTAIPFQISKENQGLMILEVFLTGIDNIRNQQYDAHTRSYLIAADETVVIPYTYGDTRFHNSQTLTWCFSDKLETSTFHEKPYLNHLWEKVVWAYMYMSDIDGFLVYETEYSYFHKLVWEILSILLVAGIGIFIITFLIISRSIKSLTAPISHLCQHIKEVEKKKNFKPIEIREASDEVQSLAHSFSSMIAEAQTDDYIVQKQVIEQTRALKDKHKKLLKFQKAVDAASDYIAILWKDGSIVHMNEAMQQETGFSLKECLGKHPTEFWRKKEKRETCEALMQNTTKTKKSQTVELTTTRKDGSSFLSQVHMSPVISETWRIVFFVTIEHDITKEKEIWEMKDEFISLVSHELRTPMTVIQGYSELLLNKDFWSLNSEQTKYIDCISKNTKYLLSMVNNMLDLEKLNAGKMKFCYSQFDIKSLMQELQEEYKNMCAQKSIKISMSCKSQDIYSDKHKLREVLINFIWNAYKFTPNGGRISLQVRVREELVYIRVTDTWIGIAEKDFSKVFEKFSQVESSLQKSQKGSGLGLSICKLIIEKLGWEVWFTSTYGKWTSFFFHIPISKKMSDLHLKEK